MSTFNMTSFHTHMLALQRGTVVATARNEFVIKSSNRMLEVWHLNSGTKLLNVGGSQTGMAAMTGGTMAARRPHEHAGEETLPRVTWYSSSANASTASSSRSWCCSRRR